MTLFTVKSSPSPQGGGRRQDRTDPAFIYFFTKVKQMIHLSVSLRLSSFVDLHFCRASSDPQSFEGQTFLWRRGENKRRRREEAGVVVPPPLTPPAPSPCRSIKQSERLEVAVADVGAAVGGHDLSGQRRRLRSQPSFTCFQLRFFFFFRTLL